MQNAIQLAMRDPAWAALHGALDGADFGAEFGDDLDIGAEFGEEFGADAPTHLAQAPSHQQLVAMWQAVQVKKQHAAHRTLLLDPNRHSNLKVERYIMALSDTITIGVAAAIDMFGQPDCTFRPNRFTMVVPTPGFVVISDIKMANVSVNIGPGFIDAFQFNANGVGQGMDMPTLTPANRAKVTGTYTGFPGGFPSSPAFSYELTATFIGPSSLAGSAGI